jgi:hypothetical protein
VEAAALDAIDLVLKSGKAGHEVYGDLIPLEPGDFCGGIPDIERDQSLITMIHGKLHINDVGK